MRHPLRCLPQCSHPWQPKSVSTAQEVSHVFHCMQCDLQFQMDMAITSRKGSHAIDAGVVRVRLDPRIKLEREA